MAALVDTNVLVYRFDPRFPVKQRVAADLLRSGIESGELRLAHQVVLEFVAVMSRPLAGGEPLLDRDDVTHETEELLLQFDVLYPNADIVRLALRGRATYGLSWYDAHLWAYAEHYGLTELYSEDFQHDRVYGTVRVIDPFADRTAA